METQKSKKEKQMILVFLIILLLLVILSFVMPQAPYSERWIKLPF